MTAYPTCGICDIKFNAESTFFAHFQTVHGISEKDLRSMAVKTTCPNCERNENALAALHERSAKHIRQCEDAVKALREENTRLERVVKQQVEHVVEASEGRIAMRHKLKAAVRGLVECRSILHDEFCSGDHHSFCVDVDVLLEELRDEK